MSFIDLFLLILATWRVTNIITAEDGPWDINRRIRRYFFAGEFNPADPDLELFTTEEMNWWVELPGLPVQGFFGKLLTCALCTSVWVGAFFGFTYMAFPHIALLLAIPFALSGGSLVFGEIYGNLQEEEK